MPILPLPEVPADATFEDLLGITGELRLALAWLMQQIDRQFVQQKGYAGQNMLQDHSFEALPKAEWAATTDWFVDDLVVPIGLNGFIYRCTVAGKTAATEPVWPTVLTNTVADGTVTWRCEFVAVDREFPIERNILSYWDRQGFPRFRSTYGAAGGISPYSLFGRQSLFVSNTDYAYQRVDTLVDHRDGPYCFSVWASPKRNNTAAVKLTCTLVLRALDSSNVELGVVTRSFTVAESYSANDNGKWTRGFITYENLPANTVKLEVQAKSASTEWLEIDGCQLVPVARPEVYNPENQLWAHVQQRNVSHWHFNLKNYGDVELYDPTVSYSAFLTPGIGGTNKLVIASATGVEHNTAKDGSGTVMNAVNSEGKNYAPWVQLQNDNATTSPLVGAIRSNGSVPQFYDGTAWRNFSPFSAPAARVYHSAAQTIADVTSTTLAFDSERFDTDTIHDTVTNNSRLTCKTAGKYQITANVEWAGNAVGERIVELRLNATSTIGRTEFLPNAALATSVCVDALYDLAVNDYVEVRVYQNSGGNLNVNASANYSPEFSMVRVG